MRVLLRVRDETGANRVRHYVANHVCPFPIIADHPFETVPLPEARGPPLFEVVTGVLLRGLYERFAVGIVPDAVDQQMDVIRHVAGRGDFEPILACSTQNLRPHEIDSG